MKILISWLAFNNDFKDGSVSEEGPTSNFHEHFFDHDKHIILYASKEQDVRAELLRTFITSKYAKRPIETMELTVKDVINVHEIQTKVNELLISLKEHELDIFISPGTPAMQTAWYLAHASLGLKTRLFQMRSARHTKTNVPELIPVELSNNLIPNTAVHATIDEKGVDKEILITSSIEPIYEKAKQVALASNVTSLIYGGSGTGKENLAKFIHDNSPRKEFPFIPINCSAFSDQLLESQLFGYKKGAFTGAEKDTKGLFEEADGGTIFLDEIGDISPYMQQALLRVLQEKEIRPIGGKPKKVNVRIIAATNRNLTQRCKDEKFRWDLYYRLSVVTLELPDLFDRGISDVKAMIEHFVKTKKKDFNRSVKLKLEKKAMDKLLNYTYPGNIRELENIISHLYVFNEEKVSEDSLPKYLRPSEEGSPMNYKDVEKAHIERVLNYFNGNRTKTAKAIGWVYNTLNKKVKEYSLDHLIND